ncbi:MAG: DNA repair photolyase, partial [Limisphaerales bacterium]
DFPKTIINRVESPDIGPTYSLNPYQGCEHGCIYCYARNTHTYWGYSAGLDFESKILVKESAPALLEAEFRKPNWEPLPVMLSGNTDCYQPAEKKYKITRKLLEVFLRYKHPVGIITKNTLIKRDLDLIEALNEHNLVAVNVSLTSLDPKLRAAMEPRTAHPAKRLALIKTLTDMGVPVNVMLAPIIPGLNNSEIPNLVKAAGEVGARSANMIVLRLPGDVGLIFTDWLFKHFPDRADKVLSQVKSIHGGKLYDSRFKVRMRGQGPIAESMHALFKMSKAKYIKGPPIPKLNVDAFIKQGAKQLGLF